MLGFCLTELLAVLEKHFIALVKHISDFQLMCNLILFYIIDINTVYRYILYFT